MSLVTKSIETDKQQNGVYLLLDAFIREKMFRRLFTFRRPKLDQEGKASASSNQTQKENLDPNTQVQDALKKTDDGKVEQDKFSSSSIGSDTERLRREANEEFSPICRSCSEEDSGVANYPQNTEELQVPDSCTDSERNVSSPSDTESETKDCEKVKEEVSKADETERCESVISAEESSKDESRIEPDMESTDDSPVKVKSEPSLPDEKERISTSKCNPGPYAQVPLVPINLKSQLNDRIKVCDRISNTASTTTEPESKSYESPIKECSSSLSSTRKEMLVQNVRYSQRLTVNSIREPRWNRAPEMFGNLTTRDGASKRSQYRSPVRRGILKNPSGSKFGTTGAKFTTTNRKQKDVVSKEKREDCFSSDSGLSESEASSEEEQKRMPVRKIFSNQQTLRKKIDDLDGMLKTMQEQKSELQAVLEIAKDWSEALRNVERTKLGVPYIRAVKQLLAEQRTALNSKKSDFNRKITNLKESEVPYLEELCNLIWQLRKEITFVARDQRKYSSRSVENIRQLQGKLIGSCTAILAVYYEQ